MSVAVCIVVQDNFQATKYCIENMLEKANEKKFDLFVFNNGSTDNRLDEYLKTLDNVCFMWKSELKVELSVAYNHLFEATFNGKYKYVCTFQSDILVSKNWLTQLVYTIENISVKSGIVGIKNNIDNLKMQSIMFNSDTHENVWFAFNETVSGVCLFETELIKKIGGYNESLSISGFEQDDLCFRATLEGAINYYITGQESVRTGLISEGINPRKNRSDWDKYKQHVEKIAKENNQKELS